MSSKLRSLIALSCLAPAGAMADAPTVYGRINLTAQQNSTETLQFVSASDTVTTTKSDTTTLENNVSRIGFKGSEKFADLGLEGFYLAEYAVYADDGVDGTDPNTTSIRQRNIYFGLKGSFGAAQAGYFDTPLKSVQNKVDLFNDLQGDINNYITVNDYRRKNSVMYTTPKMSGFTGYIDLILSEGNSKEQDAINKEKGRDNAASLALTYEQGGFYGAIAFDKNVVVVESNKNLNDESQVYRLVAQYTLGAWQLGALYDNHDATTYTAAADNKSLVGKENQGGWIVSSQYTLGQWALKAQYGQSDILRGAEVERDADVLSLGADYKLSKNTRLFGFYTTESADVSWQKTKSTGTVTASQGNDYFALGGELIF
ncbi:MAG TPA: porin [Cellvibrionaceae bacterium]|nr:porin [Cellvibrionaceae bacterium]HNG58759.1 porin [Cellvibrionaceae bacterium]